MAGQGTTTTDPHYTAAWPRPRNRWPQVACPSARPWSSTGTWSPRDPTAASRTGPHRARRNHLPAPGRTPHRLPRRHALHDVGPCDLCTGAVLLFGIPRVVVGEAVNFPGPWSCCAPGVEVTIWTTRGPPTSWQASSPNGPTCGTRTSASPTPPDARTARPGTHFVPETSTPDSVVPMNKQTSPGGSPPPARRSPRPRTSFSGGPGPDTPESIRKTRNKVVAASFIGNFVEWFDYAVYGYLAVTITAVFFPEADPADRPAADLRALRRLVLRPPAGRFVWGHLGDKIGRRTALSWSIPHHVGGHLLHRADPRLRQHRHRRTDPAPSHPRHPGLLRLGEYAAPRPSSSNTPRRSAVASTPRWFRPARPAACCSVRCSRPC